MLEQASRQQQKNISGDFHHSFIVLCLISLWMQCISGYYGLISEISQSQLLGFMPQAKFETQVHLKYFSFNIPGRQNCIFVSTSKATTNWSFRVLQYFKPTKSQSRPMSGSVDHLQPQQLEVAMGQLATSDEVSSRK